MKIALNHLLLVLNPKLEPWVKPWPKGQMETAIRHARSCAKTAKDARLTMEKWKADPQYLADVLEALRDIEFAWEAIARDLKSRLRNPDGVLWVKPAPRE